MAKWIKNVSGESRNVLGVPVADGAFYQIPSSKEVAAAENSDILTWVAASEMEMSEDGSTTISDAAAGLQYLNGFAKVRDTDGAEMSRVKMFKTGVAVRFHFFQITTAKYVDGYKHDKADNTTDFGYITYKIYDNTDTEITSAANEGNAVKTVVDWEPPSINYEIVGGKFYQAAAPGSDVYVHVVGVPDVPEGSGGSIPFCSNANLKLMGGGTAFETDGRVPKTMNYDATYHTSKLRISFYHTAGVQHTCQGELEIAH
jgi:hypothetical protein